MEKILIVSRQVPRVCVFAAIDLRNTNIQNLKIKKFYIWLSYFYYYKNKNKVFCKRPKCVCPTFSHVPVFGSNDFKCLCKHSYTEHDPISKKCIKGMCGCNKFSSAWTCSCGSKYGEHITIVETKQERIAQGKSVDDVSAMVRDLNVPFQPGGLTSF